MIPPLDLPKISQQILTKERVWDRKITSCEGHMTTITTKVGIIALLSSTFWIKTFLLLSDEAESRLLRWPKQLTRSCSVPWPGPLRHPRPLELPRRPQPWQPPFTQNCGSLESSPSVRPINSKTWPPSSQQGPMAKQLHQVCRIGQPKFFWDFCLKLHRWVWPKPWPNFLVPTQNCFTKTWELWTRAL